MTSTPPGTGVIDSTWLFNRTRSPSGFATCSGSACMPVAGTAGRPSANIRTSSFVKLADEQPWLAHRVGEHLQAVRASDQHAGAEGLEIERRHVDPPSHRRVGGVEHMEATIAAEAVDDVGADAPADPVARLEDDDLVTELGQSSRAPQPCQPCPDDDDVSVHEGSPHCSSPAPV